MHEEAAGLDWLGQLILWAGFLGAWLLVVGPLHQARLELAEEELGRERFTPYFDGIERHRVSTWWWLLPPVRVYLSRRARERFQRELWLTLPDEEYEALSSYLNKARGWLLVGGGGLLIAVKETYELVEGMAWSTWLFWLLVAAMAAFCVSYVSVQAARDRGSAGARASQRADDRAGGDAPAQ